MIRVTLKDKCAKADFKKIFAKKGYSFFEKGAYNLNIIGVRAKGNEVNNIFDDVLVLIYKTDEGIWKRQFYKITTQPGKHYMDKPMNSKGTAILVPGQYRGAYKIDKHRGKYFALCQRKPVKIWRDNNRDNIYDLDPNTLDEGMFGINIHKSGENKYFINEYSAGCQVFAINSQFNCFMNYCRKQIANGFGNSFTYTLINEEDLEC